MIHGETLRAYVDEPFSWDGDEDAALMYVPRFDVAQVPAIRKQVKQSGAVTLYSWQPETLRQHVRAAHVQHEAIPESLARRFGLKG